MISKIQLWNVDLFRQQHFMTIVLLHMMSQDMDKSYHIDSNKSITTCIVTLAMTLKQRLDRSLFIYLFIYRKLKKIKKLNKGNLIQLAVSFI